MRDGAAAWRRTILPAVGIAVLTVLLFAPSLGHQFTNFDDDSYVSLNSLVRDGLTWDSIRRSFTTFHAANWHPLTWVSHALDVSLFGLNPAGHHMTSVVVHALNAALLYGLLCRMTGSAARSALVSALFAIHPLHVESVAWVAGRKDVLSTFFGLLTTAAYLRFARKAGARWLTIAAGCFALSLMSKAMLVSLPLLLLLFDYWPLGRLRGRGWDAASWVVLLEKLPFLALAAAASAVTWLAQSGAGTIQPIVGYSVAMRLSNAVVSLWRYLLLAAWPSGLSIYYPLPAGPLTPSRFALLALALVALTAVSIALRRRHPALLVGWLWYLIAIVPVVGLVQVGQQAMADRYTYVPLIGIFLAVAWHVPGCPFERRGWRTLGALIMAATLVSLGAVTRLQLAHWRDSVTLFEHALAVTSANWLAHGQLGQAYAAAGQPDAALFHYEEALRIDPFNAYAAEYNHGLAMMLLSRGRPREAYGRFQSAVKIQPALVEAHNGMGVAAAAQGEYALAAKHFTDAVRLKPTNPLWHYKAGLMLERIGQQSAARASYERALRLAPDFAEALQGLRRTLQPR